jgi:hypothetical protein
MTFNHDFPPQIVVLNLNKSDILKVSLRLGRQQKRERERDALLLVREFSAKQSYWVRSVER